MRYAHIQYGHLHWLLQGVAVLLLAGGSLTAKGSPVVVITLLGAAALLFLSSLAFQHLTIVDGGDHLALRYGPLPLFRKRVPYRAITGVRRGKTAFIDGWGIHYTPGRGWTYNIGGFDCVVVELGGKTIRIGSDDADKLAEFLQQQIATSPAEAAERRG